MSLLHRDWSFAYYMLPDFMTVVAGAHAEEEALYRQRRVCSGLRLCRGRGGFVEADRMPQIGEYPRMIEHATFLLILYPLFISKGNKIRTHRFNKIIKTIYVCPNNFDLEL